MSYRLSKLDVLKLALQGAIVERGTAQYLSDEEWDDLDKGIAELERRVEVARRAEQARGHRPCAHSWSEESPANGWRSVCRLCGVPAQGSGQ